MSVYNFEDLGPQHDQLLAEVTALGCDITQTIPNSKRIIGYGNGVNGYGPMGLLDLTNTEYVAEPHVIWFPWTTKRSKISLFKYVVEILAKTHEVLLNVQKEHILFFDHFAKQGYIRKIGYITNLPIVEEIHMYQYHKTQRDV
jgi:hypothetical protein